MIVIDSHLDLSYNALNWNRDLREPLSTIRAREAQMTERGRGTNTVSLPALRSGEVGICLATVLARANPTGRSNIDFRNQEIAYAMAQGQLAYYRMLEQQGECRFIRNHSELENSFKAWRVAPQSTPFGFIISMEGADPIVSPSHVSQWWESGLRAVGMAHYGPSAYAHGTGSPGPLTSAGYDLLRAMAEVGMVLDVTHLADESFWQAIERWKGPLLASHNNCRALVPGDRQFSDDQIRTIIERGGVIGAAFDAWMLAPGWTLGHKPQVKLEAVIDHIDHVCQIAGNTRHSAIGSDLDGGFGTEQTPEGIDSIADLQKIPALLKARGYQDSDITGIMHGNWLRFFATAWGQTGTLLA